jgi:short-subunit dehydrogenase
MKLTGAVVVVTGAGSGIGQATAVMLAERGATVVAVDVNAEAIEKLTASTGGLAVAVDIADPGHGDAVVASALDRYGRIDAVVANAGVGYVGDFATMPPDTITTLVEVNFRGPMVLTRAALPGMLERGDGALVYTTSIAGGVPVPTEAAYCLSKAALENFADSLREEVRTSGIVVTTIRPGVVRTAFHDHRNKPYSRKIPRPVAPEKIAEAILDALEHDKTRRTVPGWIELAVTAQRRMPRLFEVMARRFGGN